MATDTLQDFTPRILKLRNALLDIKRLAEKSGDQESDPFALLDLIAGYARNALQSTV